MLKNLKFSMLKKKSSSSSTEISGKKANQLLDETEVSVSEGEDGSSTFTLNRECEPKTSHNTCSTVTEEDNVQAEETRNLSNSSPREKKSVKFDNMQAETRTLSNSPPREGKKSVKFADAEEVHDVLRRRSQISRQSMAGIWCNDEDFEAFMDDAFKCVKRMERGERLKDKKYSSLGLESQTEEGDALKQAHKEYAWNMVLWEQSQQQKEGKRSSLQLREAYREASRDAEVRAVELARQVSDEVHEYYKKAGLDPAFEPDHFDDPDVASLRTKPVKVRFADEPEVHEVLRRRSQISRQSKIGVWYGGEDFDAFLEEMDACIEKLDEGDSVDDNDHSSIGLESQTQEGRSESACNKLDSWDIVLGEQQQQRELGFDSPFQISRAYRKVSSGAALKAITLARKVSEEVGEDNVDIMMFCPTNASA